MKRIVASAAALAILAAPVGAWGQTKNPDKIVVAAYGGIWAESVKKNFVSCFEKKTGVKVDVVTGESADWLARIRANPSNPPIHVVALAEADSLRAGQEGLLDKITVEKAANFADIPEQFHKPWNDFSVVQNFGALGIMYNKDVIKDPPASWKEFLENTAAGKYGKRVSMPAGTYTWGPEFLWLLSQQYGGNIDQAFAKVKAASANVVKFWSTPVEALNLYGTKEVDIMAYWDGRAVNFIDKGNPWTGFYIPKPNTIAGSVLVSKVKNAPEIAWEYMNCAMSPEGQAGHSSSILYSVSNPKVVVADDVKAKLTPASQVVFPPYPEVFPEFPKWIERWNKELR
jgi:putative spermidine/putrescine transport system substrate-binding protein